MIHNKCVHDARGEKKCRLLAGEKRLMTTVVRGFFFFFLTDACTLVNVFRCVQNEDSAKEKAAFVEERVFNNESRQRGFKNTRIVLKIQREICVHVGKIQPRYFIF